MGSTVQSWGLLGQLAAQMVLALIVLKSKLVFSKRTGGRSDLSMYGQDIIYCSNGGMFENGRREVNAF